MITRMHKISEVKIECFEHDGMPITKVSDHNGTNVLVSGRHARELNNVIQDILNDLFKRSED